MEVPMDASELPVAESEGSSEELKEGRGNPDGFDPAPSKPEDHDATNEEEKPADAVLASKQCTEEDPEIEQEKDAESTLTEEVAGDILQTAEKLCSSDSCDDSEDEETEEVQQSRIGMISLGQWLILYIFQWYQILFALQRKCGADKIEDTVIDTELPNSNILETDTVDDITPAADVMKSECDADQIEDTLIETPAPDETKSSPVDNKSEVEDRNNCKDNEDGKKEKEQENSCSAETPDKEVKESSELQGPSEASGEDDLKVGPVPVISSILVQSKRAHNSTYKEFSMKNNKKMDEGGYGLEKESSECGADDIEDTLIETELPYNNILETDTTDTITPAPDETKSSPVENKSEVEDRNNCEDNEDGKKEKEQENYCSAETPDKKGKESSELQGPSEAFGEDDSRIGSVPVISSILVQNKRKHNSTYKEFSMKNNKKMDEGGYGLEKESSECGADDIEDTLIETELPYNNILETDTTDTITPAPDETKSSPVENKSEVEDRNNCEDNEDGKKEKEQENSCSAETPDKKGKESSELQGPSEAFGEDDSRIGSVPVISSILVQNKRKHNSTYNEFSMKNNKKMDEGGYGLEKESISPECKQLGVLDEKDVCIECEVLNKFIKESIKTVRGEEIHRTTIGTSNKKNLDINQAEEETHRTISPVDGQPDVQNGEEETIDTKFELVHQASELSSIKNVMQKVNNAITFGQLDEEASVCSDVSWNDRIQFYSVHGASVRLSDDGFLAQRHKFANFFGKGIVFSSRPIGIEEKICVRFDEISNYWLGFMTFGFTNHDPKTIAGDLPGIAVTDLDKKPGYWAGHLAKTFCNKGNIFHYYVNASGSVHFGINGVDKGTLFWNVDTTKPIWALGDLFGYFTVVSFIDPKTTIEAGTYNSLKENEHFSDVTPWITSSPFPCLKFQNGIKLVPLNLHTTKGMNVQMMNFKGVAARCAGTSIVSQGYVFTDRPMYLGQTIVIQILATGPGYEFLPIGLTANDPSTLNPRELPDDAEGLSEWGQNWVLIKNVANFIQSGDELAVTRTIDGDIRLKKNNGENITVARFSKAQKFWAFVEIYGATQMIRMWTTKRSCPCARKTSGSP